MRALRVSETQTSAGLHSWEPAPWVARWGRWLSVQPEMHSMAHGLRLSTCLLEQGGGTQMLVTAGAFSRKRLVGTSWGVGHVHPPCAV